MFYLPSGVRSFIAPGKLFRKQLHLCWSCVGCPAKSGNSGSPALRDLTIADSITVAGPLQRDGPQTDVAGSVRTERTHKAVTTSLGGTELSGNPARPPRRRRTGPWCPRRCGAPPSGDAGPAASLYLWKVLRPRPESLGSEQFLKTTQESPQKATHHLVGTKNTLAEHRAGVRRCPE